ncbi:hypothetical protein CYMTET_46384, partial [Cymbomonas tetramitiformis]
DGLEHVRHVGRMAWSISEINNRGCGDADLATSERYDTASAAPHVQVTALTPIAPGDELCITYTDLLQPTNVVSSLVPRINAALSLGACNSLARDMNMRP